MQALILSAGLGTRLKPLTDSLPKVMLPIGGKPLLEHHLEQFRKHGVEEFLINLHHLPEKITEYFGDGSKWGVKIIYKYEPEILGTAGGIKNFENEIKDDFFVVYGDMLTSVDYSKFYEYHQTKTKDFCIGVILIALPGHFCSHPYDSDLGILDKNMRIVSILSKPHKDLPSSYCTLEALYIFNREIFKYIPKGTYCEIDHNLLPEVIKKEAIYGYPLQGRDYIRDIGTVERYKQAQEDLKEIFRNF